MSDFIFVCITATETTTDSSETEAPEATEGTESEEEAPAEERKFSSIDEFIIIAFFLTRVSLNKNVSINIVFDCFMNDFVADAETEISPDPEESSGEIVSPDVEEEESSVDDSSSSSLSVMVASIMSLWGVFCILIQ